MSSTKLGEKRWTWYDTKRYGYKVGVAVYTKCVVVHFPLPEWDMSIRYFDDPELADAYGRLVKRAIQSISGEFTDENMRDFLDLREAIA